MRTIIDMSKVRPSPNLRKVAGEVSPYNNRNNNNNNNNNGVATNGVVCAFVACFFFCFEFARNFTTRKFRDQKTWNNFFFNVISL